MQLADIKIIVEIIQGIITTLGILIAGIWSYWTFVISSGRAKNVRLDLASRYSFTLHDKHFLVLHIQAHNTGRTKVVNHGCFVAVEALPLNVRENINFARADDPFSYYHLNRAKSYSVLASASYLEPLEQISEDIVLQVEPDNILRVALLWNDSREYWSLIQIIDPEIIKNASTGEPKNLRGKKRGR